MEKRSLSFKDILILLCCVLLMATTMGIVNMVLSIFYPIVSLDLEVSRASFSLTGTITAISAMIASLFWGLHYSKKPLQAGMVICIMILGLSFMGMQAATDLYHFYALAMVIGIAYAGSSIIPVSIIVTRHFTSKTGLTLSAALAGSGLGAMVLNPIINTLINNSGWRDGYLLLAMVTLAITLPCGILVTQLTKGETQVRQTPAETATANQAAPLFKRAWVWAFLSGAFLAGFTGGAVLANLPTYLKDLNFPVSRVSFVTSAYAASLVIGKFILGFLYDRLGAKASTVVAGLTMALSLALMVVIDAPIMLALMLINIGIGLAIGTVSITWLANYFFSKEDYSKYYGTVQFANSLGIAAGVPIIASALENLANTDLLWISLSLLGVLMGFLFIKSINGNQKEKAAAISSTIEATKRG